MSKIAVILCLVLLASSAESQVIANLIASTITSILETITTLVSNALTSLEDPTSALSTALTGLQTFIAEQLQEWGTNVTNLVEFYQLAILLIQEAVASFDVSQCVPYSSNELQALANQTWEATGDCINQVLTNANTYAESIGTQLTTIQDNINSFGTDAVACAAIYTDDPGLGTAIRSRACIRAVLASAALEIARIVASSIPNTLTAVSTIVATKIELKACLANVTIETITNVVQEKIDTYQTCVDELVAVLV